jgi:hypothetical protein
MKSVNVGNPFSLHFDFGMVDRSHNVRLSISNLFKQLHTSNGNVVQVPLEVSSQKWTIVVIDITELFKIANLFHSSYKIDGSYSMKSITLCANM